MERVDGLGVGWLMRKLREARGMSRARLCELSGLPLSSVFRLESPHLVVLWPRRKTVSALYEAFSPLTDAEVAEFERVFRFKCLRELGGAA